MRGKNRIPIASGLKLPQFTIMNAIEGQDGLVNYSSLIFYSLTIDNILNIIVLLILAGVSIATLTGENGLLNKASDAKIATEIADIKEQIQTDIIGEQAGNQGNMMNIVMSGMMFYFGYITPSAVALYYVVSNIFQWIFMSVIRKIVISKEEAIENARRYKAPLIYYCSIYQYFNFFYERSNQFNVLEPLIIISVFSLIIGIITKIILNKKVVENL